MSVKNILKQWIMTFRPLPVILSWLVAAAVAWATQGFPAHIWNDIFDWLSGTDKLVDVEKTPTGGSHVVQTFYKDDNVFKHLKNHVPWIAVCTMAVVYFGFVLGWWWYVLLGGIAAVFISVFYSTPPIQADHRPFVGEWVFAFGGIMVSNAFMYYAAAHSWPSAVALLCMVPYVAGNVFMLEMHHVNDIYPDLHAEPKKKYTAISWLYEKYKHYFWNSAICEYFAIIAGVTVSVAVVTAILAGVYPLLVFVPLYCYGMYLTSEYIDIDFEKYPQYLEKTVPLELKWINAHTLTGLAFAGLVAALAFLSI